MAYTLNRDQLIRRAFQLAGLVHAQQQPDADDLALAADFFAMELDALQAEGAAVLLTERTTLAITTPDSEYTLPSDVLDVVVGPDNLVGTFTPVGSNIERPVYHQTRQDWTAEPNKTLMGPPTLVTIERVTSVNLIFWPTPDTDGAFRYNKVRFRADIATGAAFPEVARRWYKALTWSVAHHVALAKSAPLGRVEYLGKSSELYKARARVAETEHGNLQFYVEAS